jgi:hypothetical protein|tara:strand:+ start:1258 stop:1500 length:243 start_codon:yes stop_codon:yes gene_type:complete
MFLYSTDKTKLEAANAAIDSGLGYPTSTVTTWAQIIESDSNTYLMSVSEFVKQYLTSEQLGLMVNDLPSEFGIKESELLE